MGKRSQRLVHSLLVAWFCVGWPSGVWSDEAFPRVLFELKTNASNTDQRATANVLQILLRKEMQGEQIRFVSKDEYDPDDPEAFIREHAVEYYFDGEIDFTTLGISITLRLKKVIHNPSGTVHSEMLFPYTIPIGRDENQEQAQGKIEERVSRVILPNARFLMAPNGRHRILAYCIWPEEPTQDVKPRRRQITTRYASVTGGLLDSGHRVKGLDVAEFATFCDKIQDHPLKHAYDHVIQGFLGGEDNIIIDLNWDREFVIVEASSADVEALLLSVAEKAAEKARQPH